MFRVLGFHGFVSWTWDCALPSTAARSAARKNKRPSWESPAPSRPRYQGCIFCVHRSEAESLDPEKQARGRSLSTGRVGRESAGEGCIDGLRTRSARSKEGKRSLEPAQFRGLRRNRSRTMPAESTICLSNAGQTGSALVFRFEASKILVRWIEKEVELRGDDRAWRLQHGQNTFGDPRITDRSGSQ